MIDSMAVQKAKGDQYKLPKSFWLILVGLALVVIILLGWLLIWRSGWPNYVQGLNQCGGKPPVIASTFITSTYVTPADDRYRIPGAASDIYFCSEADAKAAGFHKLK